MGEDSQEERKITPGQQDSGSCSMLITNIKIHLYLLEILRNQVFPAIQRDAKKQSCFTAYLHLLCKDAKVQPQLGR